MSPLETFWKTDSPTASTREEFSPGQSEWDPGLKRRDFLKIALGSLALGGFTGCLRPLKSIFPYVENPATDPGAAVPYAAALSYGGFSHGLLVETYDGHPTHIDGHPEHPAGRGASTAWQQAAIELLYSSKRSSRQIRDGQDSSWKKWQEEMAQVREELKKSRGQGAYLVTEMNSSPAMAGFVRELQKHYPRLRWFQEEAFSLATEQKANRFLFQRDLHSVYHFDRADCVFSFSADFVQNPLYPATYAQDFILRRRREESAGRRPFLWVAESTPTLTGALADERVILEPDEILWQAQGLYQGISPSGGGPFTKLLEKIKQHPGRCLFIAGPEQSFEVHVLCQSLNARFAQHCVTWVDSFLPSESEIERERFFRSLRKGEIRHLWMIGGNPAYHWDMNEDCVQAWREIPRSYRFALGEDETSELCHWHLPLAHPFEYDSEGRSFDGGLTFSQALIEPLFAGLSPEDILKQMHPRGSFPEDWKKRWPAELRRRSFREGSKGQYLSSRRRPALSATSEVSSLQYRVVFRPDAFIQDGRFAQSSWLRECPRPLTSLTWENAILISPFLANDKSLKNGDRLRLRTKAGKQLEGPVWILPGQAPRTLTLTVGYGQKNNLDASARGYRAADLGLPYNETPAVEIEVLKERQPLAATQNHQILPTDSPLGKKSAEPAVVESFYSQGSPQLSAEVAWGMVIDLDSCTGCSACTVACQSENNIPSVGKEGVLRGRQMHWIRVDRYFSGEAAQPRIYFQPVPCMHCENAPCEAVCPVGATVHSSDGLNQMVYNRCVGTRYCSNNCPYKVRRFNFLSYEKLSEKDLRRWRQNPQVTVRSRGVMEKCTYCVQRIESARKQSEKEQTEMKEVRTACQVACPTRAIHFGNLRDPRSEVAQARRNPRHYILLEELSTKPRTTYLSPRGVLL